jgi:hypothetical protein
MYGFRNKLVCLSKLVCFEAGNRKDTLAYYEICPFAIKYECVMFYNTDPGQIYRLNFVKPFFYNHRKIHITAF